jgi:protein subunit release factor A
MEQNIEKAEAEVAAIQEQLEDPAIMSDAERLGKLYAQLTEAEGKVRRLYQRWGELEALHEQLSKEDETPPA